MAETFDWTLDVLVIGGGGCGLAAAIAAHDAGAEVAIVEKLDRPGGNTALSTGSVPGAGSRFQRAAGIQDSPEQMIADYERKVRAFLAEVEKQFGGAAESARLPLSML